MNTTNYCECTGEDICNCELCLACVQCKTHDKCNCNGIKVTVLCEECGLDAINCACENCRCQYCKDHDCTCNVRESEPTEQQQMRARSAGVNLGSLFRSARQSGLIAPAVDYSH